MNGSVSLQPTPLFSATVLHTHTQLTWIRYVSFIFLNKSPLSPLLCTNLMKQGLNVDKT